MLLFDRPSVSSVALLRKHNNVLLSHCCSSANVIEPREPHTCNNITNFLFHSLSDPPSISFYQFLSLYNRVWWPRAGVLKLFVHGTPDEVKEKSGTPCKRILVILILKPTISIQFKAVCNAELFKAHV
jgi:hypothetical protein